jgi:hypothetical protein
MCDFETLLVYLCKFVINNKSNNNVYNFMKYAEIPGSEKSEVSRCDSQHHSSTLQLSFPTVSYSWKVVQHQVWVLWEKSRMSECNSFQN